MFLKIFARCFILAKGLWELLWLFCLFSSLSLSVYMFSNIYTHTYVFIYIHTHTEENKQNMCMFVYTHRHTCACRFLVYILDLLIPYSSLSTKLPPVLHCERVKWLVCQTQVAHLSELSDSCAEKKGRKLNSLQLATLASN